MNRASAYIAAVLLAMPGLALAAEASDMELESLENTQWWVEDIAGKGVVDSSHTTLEFLEAGQVVGDSGCNRFMTQHEGKGTDIRFGNVAGTRRGCVPALMDQESRLYQALGEVRSWSVPPTGLLHLHDDSGETVIRAWRMSTDSTKKLE